MLSFLIAAIFATMLNSCKSPNAPAPPPPTPVLTLILLDSARVFDTVTFRAHYSDSIHASWKFEWQFGDSAKATSKDTSISHVYDSAGTYTVLVSLV
ncbi:MAG: PKD domain-containing protein, partial [Desulfobaccales bacterium]